MVEETKTKLHSSAPDAAVVLEVKQFPDPSLRAECNNIVEMNQDLSVLIRCMIETMYKYNGVGLAAPQVGVSVPVVVVDPWYSETGDKNAKILINPIIIESEGVQVEEEACLSVPMFHAPVDRSQEILVQCQDMEMQTLQFSADGFDAVVLQHEIDQVNCSLIIDRVSKLRRDMYLSKVRKALKRIEREHNSRT